MNWTKVTLCCLVLGILTVGMFVYWGARDAPEPKPHLEPFQGRWALMTGPADGPVGPTGKLFTFDGDPVTLSLPPGAKNGVGWYFVIDAVDPDHEPPRIDLTNFDTWTGKRVSTQQGVYRFDGDTLILCFSRAGAERPEKVDVDALWENPGRRS